MNGLGCCSRETGHKREPTPPEMMTGIMVTLCFVCTDANQRLHLTVLILTFQNPTDYEQWLTMKFLFIFHYSNQSSARFTATRNQGAL
jgi:hypothetical protein